MFSLRSWSEYKGPIETIRLKERPHSVFGIVTDVDGVDWQLRGQVGKYFLAAKRNEVDEWWSSTDSLDNISDGLHQQRWTPHKIEIVK